MRRFRSLAVELESGTPVERQLERTLAEVSRLIVARETREEVLAQLEGFLDGASPLVEMLVATLAGGVPSERASRIVNRLLDSPDPIVVAWAGQASKLLPTDESVPEIADREERLKAAQPRRRVAGFNTKEYDFFWRELLWDVTYDYFHSMPFADGFRDRYPEKYQPAPGFHLTQEQWLYVYSFTHDLRDERARKKVIEALERTHSMEARCALFELASWGNQIEPWPDMVGFYSRAALDVSEAAELRRQCIEKLGRSESTEYLEVLRRALLTELYRPGANPDVAREALYGLARRDSSPSGDSSLDEAVIRYVWLVATDAQFEKVIGLEDALDTAARLRGAHLKTALAELAARVEAEHPARARRIREFAAGWK
ncbi:MAG: hypothetical protein HYY17_13860 [Planctomycetes bacterium]|nr:hypothetical protein [Planctomycetota bacterium]